MANQAPAHFEPQLGWMVSPENFRQKICHGTKHTAAPANIELQQGATQEPGRQILQSHLRLQMERREFPTNI